MTYGDDEQLIDPNTFIKIMSLKGAGITIAFVLSHLEGLATEKQLIQYSGYARKTVQSAIGTLATTKMIVAHGPFETWRMTNEGREFFHLPIIDQVEFPQADFLPGYVYFIDNGDMIKIGYSTNPSVRLNDLQIGSSVPLHIVAVIAGTKQDEDHIHKKFQEYRSHGEWFEHNPELDKLIEENSLLLEKNFYSPTTTAVNNYLDIINDSAEAVDENISLLKSAGVGEPMRSRIANLDHVNPEYIKAHAAKVKREKKSAGMLIHRLKSGDPIPETKRDPEAERRKYIDGEYSDLINH